MDFVVVTQHPQLLSYVDKLQRENAEALAFYPRQVFEREAERGRLFLGLLNNEPSCYLYAGAMGVNMPIHQACVDYDARRALWGSMLVAHVEGVAQAAGVGQITLRCGFDLDANSFWRALGYQCVGVHDGGVRRMRRINVWRKFLQPNMFSEWMVDPERGTVDASVWAKNKKVGTINQFARGEAMRAYREMVKEGREA